MKVKLAICAIVNFLLMIQSLNSLYRCDLAKEVEDPRYLSIEDYKKIQTCMALISEKDLPPMQTNRCKVFFQSVKFVGDAPFEAPIFETVYLNNNPNDKRNCIVLYVSYNPPYPENVAKFITALKTIGFDGHVIYRIGGYPNLENGSFKMIDAPYAFKAAALQEAYLLGYQNLLWVDCSLTPIRNLKSLFELIEKEGYFAVTSGSSIKAQVDNGYINRETLAAVGIPYNRSFFVPHITTPMFGLNAHSPIGQELLSRFYEMAEDGSGFFSDWVDEPPISAILYQMKLKPLSTWHKFLVKEGEWDGVSNTHFFSMSIKRPEGR